MTCRRRRDYRSRTNRRAGHARGNLLRNCKAPIQNAHHRGGSVRRRCARALTAVNFVQRLEDRPVDDRLERCVARSSAYSSGAWRGSSLCTGGVRRCSMDGVCLEVKADGASALKILFLRLVTKEERGLMSNGAATLDVAGTATESRTCPRFAPAGTGFSIGRDAGGDAQGIALILRVSRWCTCCLACSWCWAGYYAYTDLVLLPSRSAFAKDIIQNYWSLLFTDIPGCGLLLTAAVLSRCGCSPKSGSSARSNCSTTYSVARRRNTRRQVPGRRSRFSS